MTIGSIGLSGASGYTPYSNNTSGSSDSKSSIESSINRLKRQRDDYEKQSISINANERSQRLADFDKRISNLQKRLDKINTDGECKTCENRKYQDGSNDPGVSFKTASKVGPEGAEAAVRGHEYEHVNRNQAKAAREGREVVYQNVVIKHGVCPECGKPYVAGGETTTVTRPKSKMDERFMIGIEDDTKKVGRFLDVVA